MTVLFNAYYSILYSEKEWYLVTPVEIDAFFNKPLKYTFHVSLVSYILMHSELHFNFPFQSPKFISICAKDLQKLIHSAMPSPEQLYLLIEFNPFIDLTGITGMIQRQFSLSCQLLNQSWFILDAGGTDFPLFSVYQNSHWRGENRQNFNWEGQVIF